MIERIAVFLFIVLAVLPSAGFAQKPVYPEIKQLKSPQNPRLGFMIHGGAGVITRGSMTPEREKEFRSKMQEALLAGYKILQDGRPGLDAVEAAIRILEDSPLFNAGKGAVFTAEGKNELDASIMNGKTLAAGAVAGLSRVKNPITLARAVMERSPHVMMAGALIADTLSLVIFAAILGVAEAGQLSVADLATAAEEAGTGASPATSPASASSPPRWRSSAPPGRPSSPGSPSRWTAGASGPCCKRRPPSRHHARRPAARRSTRGMPRTESPPTVPI